MAVSAIKFLLIIDNLSTR